MDETAPPVERSSVTKYDGSFAPKAEESARTKAKWFIKRMYGTVWVRALYLTCVILFSFVNLVLSWLVLYDVAQQKPGLVFGQQPSAVIASLLVFSIFESLFFGIDLIIWLNILWNEPDTWFCVDVANAFNIVLSEAPLAILNVYLSACQESAVSLNILIKASVILFYLLIRFITFTTVYLLNSTEDGYMDVNGFLQEEQEKMNRITHCLNMIDRSRSSRLRERCCNVLKEKKLRRFWLLARIFIICGSLLLLVTNILVFKFTFVQTYRGHLEWRRIVPSADESLENTMAERYFHDVEIFIKETEMATPKWLHLVSLEKLMMLQSMGAAEQIGLNYVESNKKIFCIFSQLITYRNGTTETSMTCWHVIEVDAFKETACTEVMDPNGGKPEISRLKSLKILFTYDPPTKDRHLGAVFYEATRTNANGTKFENVPLRLEYFQNTVAHHMAQAKGKRNEQGDDIAKSHDGWNSGPFRPRDIFLSEKDSYAKYDLGTGDLIPIRDVWKTGFAMCRSTAPWGPLRYMH